MIRPIKLLSVLLIGLFLLSGCGNAPTENESSQSNTSEVTVTEGEKNVTASNTVIRYKQASAEDIARTDYSNKTVVFKDLAEKIKITGRCSVTDNGITCDWTGSGVEFSVICDGDIAFTVSSNKDAYFTVFVDGQRVSDRFTFTKGTSTVTVATDLQKGQHDIRFIKQSCVAGLCEIKSITLNGDVFCGLNDKDLYFEFYGDSITCGAGNLEEYGEGKSAYRFEDGTKAFAFLTAENAGADYSIIAESGAGFINGYTDMSVSDMYDIVSYRRDKKAKYGFERVPNCIVIGLGTNDGNLATDTTTFEMRLEEFVKDIRTYYKTDVPIVWVSGMMSVSFFNTVKQTFERLGGMKNDLYTYGLEYNTDGVDRHPLVSAHENSAVSLSHYIKSFILELPE